MMTPKRQNLEVFWQFFGVKVYLKKHVSWEHLGVVLVRTIWSCVCWAKFQSIPEDASFRSTGTTVCSNTTDDIFSAGCKKSSLEVIFIPKSRVLKNFDINMFFAEELNKGILIVPQLILNSVHILENCNPNKKQIRIICRATSRLSCEKDDILWKQQTNPIRILFGEVPHRVTGGLSQLGKSGH